MGKMCSNLLLFFVLSLLLFAKAKGLPHDSGTCSYNFQVWEPDVNVLQRLKLLEVKLSNMSNHFEKELIVTKYGCSVDSKQYQNWTLDLERSIADLKVKVLERESAEKDKAKELNDLKQHVYEISSKVEDFILHFSERKYKSTRKKGRIRKDRMVPNTDVQKNHFVQDNYILNALRNMVSDLKAEWILMKRDLIDLRSETSGIKHGQNDLQNISRMSNQNVQGLKNRLFAVESTIKQNTANIQRVKSDARNLHNDIESIKSSQDDINAELRRVRNDVTSSVNEIKSLTQNVDHVKAQYQHLRKYSNQMAPVDSMPSAPLDDSNALPPEQYVIPKDCYDVMLAGQKTTGVYQFQADGMPEADNVYCEMVNGTAFSVIQRRVEGLLNFNRGWLEYKVGFGNLYGDFWIGNDIMHYLSNQNRYGLRVDIWDWEGNRWYAEYSEFSVGDESDSYMLRVSGYSGNAGDSLSYHNEMKFSTEDLDNDLHRNNCASQNKAGWWFNSCYSSHLNGVYHTGWYTNAQSTFADGIVWYTLKNSDRYSLRKVEMKLFRV